MTRNGTRKNTRKAHRSQRLDYLQLETRELLALSTSFHDGHLDITMFDSGDEVILDVEQGKVTINGSTDLTGSEIQAIDVNSIAVKGAAFRTDQHVVLRGNFTNTQASLKNLYVMHVSSLAIEGQYDVKGSFAVVLGRLESGFAITDSGVGEPTGRLRVNGWTWLHAANNSINLQSGEHEFGGPVHLHVSDSEQNVTIHSNSDITLSRSVIAGDLELKTTGSVSNSPQALIDIGGHAHLAASTVELGIADQEFFNTGSLTFTTDGLFRVNKNSDVVLVGDNSAQSAWITSLGSITNAAESSLTTSGFAAFYGAQGIDLGTQPDSLMTFGSLTVNSPQHVSVHHTGPTRFGGNSQVASLNLQSTEHVDNSSTAQLKVTGDFSVVSPSVSLGSHPDDTFTTGRLHFETNGPAEFRQDDSIVFFGQSSADTLLATSLENISTNSDTSIAVAGFGAFFGSSGIELGLTENNSIQLGSLTLNSPQMAHVQIDGDLTFTGNGSVNSLIASASGLINNSNLANFQVVNDARFEGSSIDLGNQFNDSVLLGRVSFHSDGDVSIQQDNRIVLFGDNLAQNATLVSPGNILDAAMTNTLVHGLLSVQGNLINLGTADDETLSIQQFTFNSAGNTNVRTISSFQITGNNFVGNRLILESAGDITDTAPSQVQVVNRIDLTAENLILGGALDRCFEILGENPLSRLTTIVPPGGTVNVVLENCGV